MARLRALHRRMGRRALHRQRRTDPLLRAARGRLGEGVLRLLRRRARRFRAVGLSMKGRIIVEFSVTCGTCDRLDGSTANSYVDAKLEFKRRSWRESETHGWRCPDCLRPPLPS